MDYLEKYSEEYEKNYSDHSFELVLIKIRRAKIIESLKRHNHDRILEIGCGLEPLFMFFSDFSSYTLVEPSPRFMENARKHAHRKSKIHFVQDYLENAYEKLSGVPPYEFIIASSLLHEVPDPEKMVNIHYKLCGLSTVIHINVPNLFSFHRLLGLEMGIVKDIHDKSEAEIRFNRHTQFDKSLLIDMVKNAGFEVLSCGTYFIKPFSNEQMGRFIKLNILDRNVISGLEKMIKYLPEMGCEIFLEARKKSDR